MLTEREAKRALISVSDKTELLNWVAPWRSSAGRSFPPGDGRVLKEAGLEVIPVSAVTGFPEILDGRVKTLHPKIHGGILARLDREEHRRQMAEQGIAPLTWWWLTSIHLRKPYPAPGDPGGSGGKY